LVEEILPISAFLGYFERPGLELYCQFYSGNQKYDARIYCEGWFVENDYLKEEYFLEVSTVCDQVDYLRRECIDKGQPFFGGPARRLANGEIESTPKSFSPEIIVEDNLSNIRSTLSKKARKGYPENTFLIIPLVPTVLLWPGEWLDVLKKLQSVNLPFCGVFVYDSVSQRKALL
jgi:hypothetical protein